MPFQANVYKVFIASPGDVEAERKIVREVIHEWNIRHADKQNTVLLPVGWETHSIPDMSTSPQNIINEQLLDKCDLLVGIFWTRVGTPTEKYASGAVEEIERYIASGKPVMLYFSSKKVDLYKLDREQYDKLLKFQESCKPRGLYKSFKNVSDFRRQLENNIAIKLHEMYHQEIGIIEKTGLESKDSLSVLSEDEKYLLKEASLDPRGTVHKLSMQAGTYIETNKKHIIRNQTAREIARWVDCLNLLIAKGYMKEEGYKGQVFKVTKSGFELADSFSDE